ncbi:MAG: phosphoribosylaminoimidazolesuccinocarboxamide synthase [Clostridiales bacterium]|nr:phosphoribosylaminoimidazolesuccinocarboxamide synthase [Clostridiales bacterium]
MSDKLFEGKVRAIYEAGENLLIVTTDRISAYDVIMPTPIEGKGKILNALSMFWFDLTKDVIKNHVITTDINEYPEPFKGDESLRDRSMLVKKLKMIPFECIVRGYITGSAWESYQKDGTVCGHKVAAGLVESDKFPEPLFTPSTKAEEGHDINVDFEYMEREIGTELATKLRDKTIEIYKICADYAAEHGIIIADTKLEFGLDENGELVLGDEVLTPDSSRFWPAADYKPGQGQSSYDKQYLRDWLSANGHKGVSPAPELPADVVAKTRAKYVEAYEIITGNKFEG